MIGYRSHWGLGFRWRTHHGAIIPLTPPHALSDIHRVHAIKYTVKKRALLIRWDEGFDREKASEWWYVVKDSKEPLEDLKPKVRTKIRKGFKFFTGQLVEKDVIKKEGYDVYRASFNRYEKLEKILSEAEFLKAIDGLPKETEFWGFRELSTGRLVAFSENYLQEGCCTYVTTWFRPEFLKASSGYLGYYVFYLMNQHYLFNVNMKYISDGARSISHPTNIHDFLIDNFGFRRAYARLRVAYAPGIGLAVALLYPFRRWIEKSKLSLLQKIAILLEQERIRRACSNVKILTE